MTWLCRLLGCDWNVLVVDGGPLRLRCTRCACTSPGWRVN